MEDITKRIEYLKDELNKSSYKYYVEEDPYLSDYEYDMLYKELEGLEKRYPNLKSEDSPTNRVGSISKGFEKQKHKHRLYSLDNTYTYEGLVDWYDGIMKQL